MVLNYFQTNPTYVVLMYSYVSIKRTVFVCLFVCLFVCFCGRPLSKELGIPIGILPTSGAGVDGNAPYQDNPGIQTNFLPPRPVQS